MSLEMRSYAASRAVVSRCEDLGLKEIAKVLENTRQDRLHPRRDCVLQALRAAEAIRHAAEHFNARPIAEYAVALESAATTALALVDEEIAALYARNPGVLRQMAPTGPQSRLCGHGKSHYERCDQCVALWREHLANREKSA